MIEHFTDGHRRHWKTYCSSCKAYLGSTAPMEVHVPRDVERSGICPKCGGKIHDEEDTEQRIKAKHN